MTERRYTLAEITNCMGPAYAEAVKQPTPERAMRIFTDLVVDALKALPRVLGVPVEDVGAETRVISLND